MYAYVFVCTGTYVRTCAYIRTYAHVYVHTVTDSISTQIERAPLSCCSYRILCVFCVWAQLHSEVLPPAGKLWYHCRVLLLAESATSKQPTDQTEWRGPEVLFRHQGRSTVARGNASLWIHVQSRQTGCVHGILVPLYRPCSLRRTTDLCEADRDCTHRGCSCPATQWHHCECRVQSAEYFIVISPMCSCYELLSLEQGNFLQCICTYIVP